MSGGRILVYLLRHDLRTADNPVLHRLSTSGDHHGYTHLLPVYVLPPDQVELSGLVKDGEICPYPRASATSSGNWKCSVHRIKFLVECVWDLKENLERLGSGLVIRAGAFDAVLKSIIQGYAGDADGPHVGAVWMVEEFSPDQILEQELVSAVCIEFGVELVQFQDQKQFIDDRDLPVQSVSDLPDVFADFQLSLEPLRDRPREPVPTPAKSSLPPLPDGASIPAQHRPFAVPETLQEIIQSLQEPLKPDYSYHHRWLDFDGEALARPPLGGETCAHERLRQVVGQGIASQYHNMRDELHESDRCHKLEAYLSFGCITARQIHRELAKLEDGAEADLALSEGFGRGQNPGTSAIRAELLHRDFVRLCVKKHRHDIFSLDGSGLGKNPGRQWKTPDDQAARPDQGLSPLNVAAIIAQFQAGTTGYGLVDAIMRQLLYTAHISPRGQMLAANFLARYAGVDWRHGVEWVASLSTDADAALHWYSWQHHAGIGPDPQGAGLAKSPVHVAFKYDPNGSLVRRWLPELQGLTKLSNLFQVSTASPGLLRQLGLSDSAMVTSPVPSNHFRRGLAQRLSHFSIPPSSKLFSNRFL
ncbi:cryptochrome [Trichoderma cornu-damae]|uniref:Cryptochrome n=1 Tax=Trichoderma cornu-damae TaxID=654480 RepID=A0A9P8QRG9_9HYPO|nr:cryptochrome [Trichoderma cornu-damae]